METKDYEKIRDAVSRSASYTYRKLLRVDLLADQCSVLKSDAGGWQPEEGPFSAQMERFARSGALHPEDVEQFVAFIQPEHMRAAARERRGALTLLYRRQAEEGFRWNLMELVPDRPEAHSAVLCVKDIHDALWESVEREGVNARSQELIRTLGEQNFNIYMIDLDIGSADPIRVDGQMRRGSAPLALPWDGLMRLHITDHLHEDYREEFERRFSLEGLRQAREEGLPKTEMLCQRRCGKTYRYISATAHFSQEPEADGYAVLALQDVDEKMRRELARNNRDARLAAILKSRFRTLTAVNLESGQCELLDLGQAGGQELTTDYNVYLQKELSLRVHPDDREKFLSVLSLEHLREKAAATRDCQEEVCLCRQRGEQVRWVERRVIYSRRGEQMIVSILGQDVTEQQQQEESRLQTLEDRAYIISSLSSLFFSTYYIDVVQDTFRAVVQLRRVEDVLGEEVNCTAALQIYANHFVHPDDREEYLRVMNVGNLRQTLRWWQPYVAVEYRRLSEEPGDEPDAGGWVRATAVLARTDGEELPKTVVYVAQDIKDTRRRAGGESGAV